MRVIFRKSFERDLKKLRGNAQLLARLQQVIEQVETAEEFGAVANVKRMQGWSSYYRIRIGDYRLGLKLEEDAVVVLRFLHRREIYRRFP
ncbi:type II toxin-antitoxin system RelE family toxin [Rubrivirga sp.]|uniref:type II toxin-antitoxin system RelE family toxin n=1 Tax=Rubrivirga sp. TaxID=1885344 RepID=UPI003B51D931